MHIYFMMNGIFQLAEDLIDENNRAFQATGAIFNNAQFPFLQ